MNINDVDLYLDNMPKCFINGLNLIADVISDRDGIEFNEARKKILDFFDSCVNEEIDTAMNRFEMELGLPKANIMVFVGPELIPTDEFVQAATSCF